MTQKRYCWLMVCSSSLMDRKVWGWRGRARLLDEGKTVVGDEEDFLRNPGHIPQPDCEVVVMTVAGHKPAANLLTRVRKMAKQYNIAVRVVDAESWVYVDDSTAQAAHVPQA